MSTEIAVKLLRLQDYETETSRLFFAHVSLNEYAFIYSNSRTLLHLSHGDIAFWTTLLEDDLVIFICSENGHLLACTVRDKSVRIDANPMTADDARLGIHLKICGEGKTKSLPARVFFQLHTRDTPAPHAVFAEMWERCRMRPGRSNEIARYHEVLLLPPLVVRLATSRTDLKFVADVAATHPFGLAAAPIILIAWLGDKRVGSLLADFSKESDRTHRAAWRVFRSEYPGIRRNGVFVLRIYNIQGARHRLRIHGALIRAIERLGPALFNEPISVIEGVSYDFHPPAFHLNYNVEVPANQDGTFYYWKPFYLPSKSLPDAAQKADVLRRTHDLLRLRRVARFWIARGARENIGIACEKSGWAVSRRHPTTGFWRVLRPGHTVFLCNPDNHLVAYGEVADTRIRDDRRYPLGIDFASIAKDFDIDISLHVEQEWFREVERGGLIPVPNEFGAAMRVQADEQIREGRMWVEPNPFILHRTSFNMTHGQVFVVQSWGLRDSVYSLIKGILSKHGYTTTHAGERAGQVIFDDVWLMLNESEAIIVDFTERRPNVYLEYGMALVLGKPVVAITQNKDDLPSDTPDLKYILYKDKLGDATLEEMLPRALRDTAEDIQRARRRRSGRES